MRLPQPIKEKVNNLVYKNWQEKFFGIEKLFLETKHKSDRKFLLEFLYFSGSLRKSALCILYKIWCQMLS